MNILLRTLELEQMKPQIPDFGIGDSVDVHYLIKEGDKERVQLFIGMVIAFKGRGIRKMVTVRRIVQGEGVERSFPVHSPRVKDITITRRGCVSTPAVSPISACSRQRSRVPTCMVCPSDSATTGRCIGSAAVAWASSTPPNRPRSAAASR